LVIVGHSFGGPAAIDLAKNLAQSEVKVDALYSIDPVVRDIFRPLSRPSNTSFLVNYRQSGTNPGKELSFADRDRLLQSSSSFAVGHMSIPGHPAILKDIEGKIAGYLNEQASRRSSETTSGDASMRGSR